MDSSSPCCQVCLRTPDNKLPFYCHGCVRNLLYEPRLDQARMLLAKEALGNEIQAIVESQSSSHHGSLPRSASIEQNSDASRRLLYEQINVETRKSRAETRAAHEESHSLHSEAAGMRERIAKRKNDLVKRRTALRTAKQELEREHEEILKPIQEEIEATKASWDKLHNRSAQARIYLCREVAALYGLDQKKRKKGALGRDQYLIGGLPIIDLRDLNNSVPEQVNTSISRVAHLLHLTSHYLGLRLPAEINLATAGQTCPLIHTPMSSYKPPMLHFGLRHPSSSQSTPRQRMLHLEKPLQQLATEDPINYSLFVDAITLLAWDVAWVARTQGIDVGAKSWEEICALGKNMWNLFVNPSAPQNTANKPSSFADLASSPTQKAPKSSGAEKNFNPPVPGQYAHNSSHSFLSSADAEGGADYMRGWRFSNPLRVIERIKSALLNERTGAEWEVLEIPESEGPDEEKAENMQTVIESQGHQENLNPPKEVARDSLPERPKPRKGWTRLRNPLTDDV